MSNEQSSVFTAIQTAWGAASKNTQFQGHAKMLLKRWRDEIVLAASCDAQMQVISQLFKRMSTRYHPDKNRDNPQAAEIFKFFCNVRDGCVKCLTTERRVLIQADFPNV